MVLCSQVNNLALLAAIWSHQVNTPATIPVRDKCQAAAIWRPGRQRIYRGVVCQQSYTAIDIDVINVPVSIKCGHVSQVDPVAGPGHGHIQQASSELDGGFAIVGIVKKDAASSAIGATSAVCNAPSGAPGGVLPVGNKLG